MESVFIENIDANFKYYFSIKLFSEQNLFKSAFFGLGYFYIISALNFKKTN